MSKYLYAVVLTPYDGGYIVTVPDLEGVSTGGKDMAEAVFMARDALSEALIVMEDEAIELAPSRLPNEIPLDHSQFSMLVDVDTTAHRALTNNRMVHKNVTLPAYLEMLASNSGLNFSYVLQKALRQELGVN